MAIEIFKCPECGGDNRVNLAPGAERDVDCIHCRRTEWELDAPPTQEQINEVERIGKKLAAMPASEEKDALQSNYERGAQALARLHRGPRSPVQVGCRFHVKAGG